MGNNKNISVKQACMLIMLEILGIGFVSVPNFAFTMAWRDGLCVILIASLLSAAYTYFIVGRLGGRGVFDTSESVLGRVTAKILRYGFIVKSVLLAGFGMRMFAHTVTRILESDIPAPVIIISLALCMLYPAFSGRKTRGALAELFLLPFAAVLIFVLVCGMRDADFDELLPIFAQGGGDIFSAVISTALWFYPVEYMLVSMPYISGEDSAKKCAFAAFAAGVIMAAVFALILARFGGAQIGSMNYPVLEMMYSVNIPGSFIERQEGLMLGLWTVGVFFTLGGCIYHAGVCGGELIGGSANVAAVLCTIAAAAAGIMVKNGESAADYFTNVLLAGESIYFAVLPVVLAIGLALEGRKNETVS